MGKMPMRPTGKMPVRPTGKMPVLPADARLAELARRPNVLRVASKIDLHPPPAGADAAVSALTLVGVEALRQAIRSRLGFDGFDPRQPMAFTPRQAELLTRAADAFDRADGPAAARSLRALLAGPGREE